MNRILVADPLIYVILMLGTAFTVATGYLLHQVLLMPILNALVIWPLFIWALRHARIDIALRLVVTWSIIIFAGGLIIGRLDMQWAQSVIPASIDYNASNMSWLTGDDNSVVTNATIWFPALVRRATGVLVGSALTAGLIPFVLASRWLSILALWTANLGNAPDAILAVPLSITPWNWAEIIAYVLLGIILAEPLLTGDVQSLLSDQRRRWLVIGLGSLLIALIFHVLLPPIVESIMRLLVF